MDDYVVAAVADAAERNQMERLRLRTVRDASNPFELAETKFRKLFRLPREAAAHLCNILVDPQLEEGEISKGIKVLAALNFYAQGSYQASVGQDSLLGLSQPSVSRYLNLTTASIVNQLAHESIKFPSTEEEKTRSKNLFQELYGMPNVLGAVDGTHIAIFKPPINHPTAPGNLFYNRKGYYSINVQMVADARGRIISINPNFPGSTHDSVIWNASHLHQTLEQQHVNGARNQWLLGIPVSQQHLVYNLRELEDAMSLRALGICDGARLRLVLGMKGGPISSRRLPPPPEPWRDIERLLDSNRDEGDWGCGGGTSGGGGGSGCRVTVVVFREGERVNMLRVRENPDGSYSPAEPTTHHSRHNCNCTYDSPPLPQVSERPGDAAGAGGAGALTQNAVTMSKMLELRRRMESLSVRRQPPGEKAEIQKTRSEETLSVPSLLDEPDSFTRTYTPYSEAEDTFTPLYDGKYTRYEYECSFGDRYTLLPPINTRTDSDQSVEDVVGDSDRLKLSDALAGSYLVAGRSGDARGEEECAAILEECVEGTRHDESAIAPNIPAHEYGPLVGGSGGGWRARGFGSSSQLAPAAHATHATHATHAHAAPAHARSASSLHVRAPPLPRHTPPLSDALFSSSTSDLEQLRRNRLLPALSRHRNTEHLHLSDDHLHLAPRPALEVGSERRQRRIEKIAELENSRVFRFGDFEDKKEEVGPKKEEVVVEKEKKIRIRCGFCRKKLSIATVHTCRCGAEFCAPHRYAEVHGCAYDYKANAHRYLQRANPLVSAPKLPKI